MSLLKKEEIEEILKKVFGNEKFVLLNYDINSKSDQLIGHMGKHFTLSVDVSSNGRQISRIFFVKTFFVHAGGDDFIGESGIFQKEIDFYRVLVRDVKRLVGDPVWCPDFYYSKERVLVLEDLSEEEYKMLSNKTTLDKAHLEAALRALSLMHASSLLLERATSTPLNSSYPQIFREILYDENKPEAPSRRWISWQVQDLMVGIEYLTDYSPEEKEQIKKNFPAEIMRIYTLSKPSTKYKNLLVHGDVWSNNLLFKYSGDVPIQCKFVDFQFSRYAPPAHDIMHLLYYATKKAERDQLKSYFIRFYYENLVKNLGGTLTELNWEDFFESVEVYKELALIQCLLSLHYLLGSSTLEHGTNTYEDYEKFLLANRASYMKRFFDTESYAEKVKDIFKELINCYIIEKSEFSIVQ